LLSCEYLQRAGVCSVTERASRISNRILRAELIVKVETLQK